MPLNIVFMASGAFAVPSLQILARSDHELALVITQPARPGGRGKKLIATPIAQTAHDLRLPCRESENVNDPRIVADINSLNPDVIIVIAFGQKIGSDLLNLDNTHVINLHCSLLPRYRGAAPVNWAILNGEKTTGVTVFELNEQWDAGLIYARQETPIDPLETAAELHDRLAALGPDVLLRVIHDIETGNLTPHPQNHTLACRAPKLKKTDGLIDWQKPAPHLQRHIHGMWPWPGAVAHVQHNDKTERVTLVRAALADESPHDQPPGLLAPDLTVFCGTGRLRLLEIKPASGKQMSFTDFANGRRLQPGHRFLNGDADIS